MATATGPVNATTTDDFRIISGSKTFATAAGDITITPPCRAVRVAGAGALAVTYASGLTDIITLNAGETQNLQLASIQATGTTATGITVFW